MGTPHAQHEPAKALGLQAARLVAILYQRGRTLFALTLPVMLGATDTARNHDTSPKFAAAIVESTPTSAGSSASLSSHIETTREPSSLSRADVPHDQPQAQTTTHSNMSARARKLLREQATTIVLEGGIVNVRDVHEPASPAFGMTFVVAVFDRSRTVLDVLPVRKEDVAADAHASVATNNTLISMNGAMVGRRRRPLGLIVVSGNLLAKFKQHGMGGVLRSNRDRTWLTPTREYIPEVFDADDYALQLHPMLVERGRMGINSPRSHYFNRTAVGVTAEGDIVIAGVFAVDGYALDLYDFAAMLMTPIDQGGGGVVDALNVDGGPGSHIYLPTEKRSWGYPRPYFITNILQISSATHVTEGGKGTRDESAK